MKTLTITVSGSAFVGKSTIMQEIQRTLAARGFLDVEVIDTDCNGRSDEEHERIVTELTTKGLKFVIDHKQTPRQGISQ